MTLDVPQLSSISTALDDLARRVTTLADEMKGTSRDDVSGDLYEIERHLLTATRRLHALLDRG